jgi:hypothetical protein
MYCRKALLAVLLTLLPAVALGQSLGELAKKEKKRRQKNQEKGAQVRVVSEEEVSTSTAREAPEPETTPGELGSPSPLKEEGSKEEKSTKSDDNTSISDHQSEEAEWRRRASEARARLNSARERYEYLNNLHITPGEVLVDENGAPVVTSLAQLRRIVSEAKAEFDAASQAIEDLKEEARRAGVPPGWLR